MTIPAELESRIDEIITHYPTKRAAVLWLLHLLQDHFGFLGPKDSVACWDLDPTRRVAREAPSHRARP